MAEMLAHIEEERDVAEHRAEELEENASRLQVRVLCTALSCFHRPRAVAVDDREFGDDLSAALLYRFQLPLQCCSHSPGPQMRPCLGGGVPTLPSAALC